MLCSKLEKWLLGQKVIQRYVSIDNGLLSCLARFRIAVLHVEYAGVTLGLDVPQEVREVDLTGARLQTPWIVGEVEVGNLIPAAVDVLNQVAILDLHMVDVKNEFDGGTIDGADN